MSAATPDIDQNAWLRDPDVQRMLLVRGGDEAAFAELVEAWQDRLIGIFSHVLHDTASAEDLAQETFLRVYRARLRYEPTAKFSTWLFRIANNLATNRKLSVSRRKEVSFKVTESGPLGPRPEEQLAAEKSALMPTRQLDSQEMREIVRQALDTLNDRQRMALLLNKFEHMSYTDIAASMDLTVPAVKSLLTRARENLRIQLEPYLSGTSGQKSRTNDAPQ
ncbi:MAG: sigma-70 family RNA polymerase sigma factor [Planctomycetota bacterium]|nr:sigma-70 family RNA polymerase sigma factor [Planctomycetota bacterium]